MRFFFGLVGLAMLGGFGFLWVDLLRDLRAYPDVPTPMTVAEATALEEPPRGSWVELTDVRFPCAMPEARAGSSVYRLGFGASEADRVVVAGSRPCSDAPTRVVGKLVTQSPGRIIDLSFEGYPFERWPRAWQTTLWPESGPEDARYGAVLLPPFALIGLFVMLFFWRPEPAPFTPLEKLTEGLPAGPLEPVLPEGGLRLASQRSARATTLGFMVVISWLFGVLAYTGATLFEGWVRVPMVAFFGALLGFMAFATGKMVLGWLREKELEAVRSWAVARVVGHEDRGFGNGVLTYVHPVTGDEKSVTYNAQDGAPIVFEGRCLVVWSVPKQAIVVRERFLPFALKPAEQRAAARRFIQHVRAKA